MASTAVLELVPAWEIPAAQTRGLSTPGDDPAIVVRAWQEFEVPALAQTWASLAKRCSEPSPFFEDWCLLPALRAFDPAGNVNLLCLEVRGRAEAIMPLVRGNNYYGHSIPHWRTWLHPNAFLGTPLVAKGFEKSFWQSLLQWADGQAGGALFLHLERLPGHGPVFQALDDVLAVATRHSQTVVREERAMLQSGLEADEYLASALSGKKRKELRRQHRRLSEEGTLTTERLDGDEALDRWVDEFLHLECAGWKGDAGSALACHGTTAGFFRELVARAAERGVLQRRALRLDGRAIAMLVNFRCPPANFAFKTAFDEHFARFSPGALLQIENMDVLSDPAIEWSDSCAAMDHPMIDQFWRERRTIESRNVAIGGAVRQTLFRLVSALESAAWSGQK